MKVFVNGEIREIAGPVSLHEFVVNLSLPTERIAVEVNKKVVRKRDWQNIAVSESDRIEIVHFVGGG